MNRNVSVVIGANYGDEGKGLVTDYLSNPDTLVVRFNGGAQAGHTVVTPEGIRHVFHHFGSGTLAGAATFLSPFFIVNPIFYNRELKELRGHGVEPKVYVDPICIVTTPYDMLINEAIERQRGTARHGSCGFGINETVVRNESAEYAITYSMLQDTALLKQKLYDIRSKYLPKRAEALGLKEPIPHQWSDALVLNFLGDVELMLGHVKSVQWASSFHAGWDRLVFEGAQGLRLDMDSPDFPHVTRSKTGLTNVLSLVKAAGISEPLNVHYLTRTYLTRHGAGPMKHEIQHLPYGSVKDDTNVPNPHQGTLRFGWLDLGDLLTFINRDMAQVRYDVAVIPKLVVTCADQLDNGKIRYYEPNGEARTAPLEDVLSHMLRRNWAVTGEGMVVSGRTRKDVQVLSGLDNRIAV